MLIFIGQSNRSISIQLIKPVNLIDQPINQCGLVWVEASAFQKKILAGAAVASPL